MDLWLPDGVQDRHSGFKGLIQHSFALRIPDMLSPAYTRRDVGDLVEVLFAPPPGVGLELVSINGLPESQPLPDSHSLLLTPNLITTIKPTRAKGLTASNQPPPAHFPKLPRPLAWAEGPGPQWDPAKVWEGLITRDDDPACGESFNDYVVRESPGSEMYKNAWEVSQLLCELLAHKRSRMFGPELVRTLVNVFLPYGYLEEDPASGERPSHAWLLQPMVSLFRANHGDGFRRIFTLTLFMIPVQGGATGELSARAMAKEEIFTSVQAGWNLASVKVVQVGGSPESPRWSRPKFRLDGPLRKYLLGLIEEGGVPGLERKTLTLRQAAEATCFATTLRLVQGPDEQADKYVRRQIGDRVLASLSASRVSCVTVVDPRLRTNVRENRLPESLGSLMTAIAQPIRVTTTMVPTERHHYRLDRPFIDQASYAAGILPSVRCIVLASSKKDQYGVEDSALLQAMRLAYMVIGASASIGMLRSVRHDIGLIAKANPSEVAEIEREVVFDLDEIYDLDMVSDDHRHSYRIVRDRLGIKSDYEALQDKLQALGRETTARHEQRSQTLLAWLTAAIVALSVLILVFTIVK